MKIRFGRTQITGPPASMPGGNKRHYYTPIYGHMPGMIVGVDWADIGSLNQDRVDGRTTYISASAHPRFAAPLKDGKLVNVRRCRTLTEARKIIRAAYKGWSCPPLAEAPGEVRGEARV